MRNIKIIIEYDGKEYGGWQSQPGKLNIQGEIERALKDITGEDINIIASGRTDSGVHSLGQVANFKTNSNILIEKVPLAINSSVKRSIRVIDAEEVDERFHARYNCREKTYRYTINNSKYGSAVYRNMEFHIPQKLNVDAMKKAIKCFEGEHDFAGFKSSSSGTKTSVRTIYKADIIEDGNRIHIELTGNGFLYNMVRIIAGTLVDVGIGKIKSDEIPDIIDSKDRARGGKTLPAYGLCLMEVKY